MFLFSALTPYEKIALLAIVASHLVVDFVLQSDKDAADKCDLRPRTYLRHGLIHAALAYLAIANWMVWQIPIAVFVTHVLIDFVKEVVIRQRAPRDSDGAVQAIWKFWAIVIDQGFHLFVLWNIIALLPALPKCPAILTGGEFTDILGPLWPKCLLLICAVVAAVNAGGVFVGILVAPLCREADLAAFQTLILEPEDVEAKRSQPMRFTRRPDSQGSRRIGQLERLLILIFILTGLPAGVGFLVAAKSILRFGDLKDHRDRAEAEYVIVGTMASFAWGLSVAIVAQHLLQLL